MTKNNYVVEWVHILYHTIYQLNAIDLLCIIIIIHVACDVFVNYTCIYHSNCSLSPTDSHVVVGMETRRQSDGILHTSRMAERNDRLTVRRLNRFSHVSLAKYLYTLILLSCFALFDMFHWLRVMAR